MIELVAGVFVLHLSRKVKVVEGRLRKRWNVRGQGRHNSSSNLTRRRARSGSRTGRRRGLLIAAAGVHGDA